MCKLDITGVVDEIFESQRAAAPWSSDMACAFDVPTSGFYEVNLFLREFWNGASDPGDGVFDVAVEGMVPAAFDNIDAEGDFGLRNDGRVSTIHVTPPYWLESLTNPARVEGVSGDALTVSPGVYSVIRRYQNAVSSDPNNHLSADAETIETSFSMTEAPVPYKQNPYRTFDGAFGLGPTVVLLVNSGNEHDESRVFSVSAMVALRLLMPRTAPALMSAISSAIRFTLPQFGIATEPTIVRMRCACI